MWDPTNNHMEHNMASRRMTRYASRSRGSRSTSPTERFQGNDQVPAICSPCKETYKSDDMYLLLLIRLPAKCPRHWRAIWFHQFTTRTACTSTEPSLNYIKNVRCKRCCQMRSTHLASQKLKRNSRPKPTQCKWRNSELRYVKASRISSQRWMPNYKFYGENRTKRTQERRN